MPRYIIQHWRATNDINGNPRRAFVIFDSLSGHHIAAFDEGYHGTRAVPPEVWDNGAFIGHVTVSVGEYRRMLDINNSLGTVR